jgi:leucyl/phenylalanyl-tRNA--protein transferase
MTDSVGATVSSGTALTDPWQFLELSAGGGVPVAIGGSLSPDAILSACYRGVFCAPTDDLEQIAANEKTYAPDVRAGDVLLLPGTESRPGAAYGVLWWLPRERYVIPVDEIAVSRSLRRTIRAVELITTVDRAFEDVITSCAHGRTPRWITAEFADAVRVLHGRGWARSVEVWEHGRLVGGLFGFALQHVFVMLSAFHRRPDAAKVAIADLARRVSGGGITLLDAEVRTEYTVRLGARPMPRDEYVCRIGARGVHGEVAGGERPAAYLLEPPPLTR